MLTPFAPQNSFFYPSQRHLKLPELKKVIKNSYTSFSPDESTAHKNKYQRNCNNLDSFQLEPFRSTENTPLLKEVPLLSLAKRNNSFISKRIRRKKNKKALSFTKISTNELMYDFEMSDPNKTHQILEKLQKSDLLARIARLRSGSIKSYNSNNNHTSIYQNNDLNLLDQGFRARSCHCSKCGVNKKAEMLSIITLHKKKAKAVVNIKKKAKIIAPEMNSSSRSMKLKLLGRSSTALITYSEDKDKKEKEKKEKEYISKSQYNSQIVNQINPRKNSIKEKVKEPVKGAQKTEKIFTPFAKSNFSTSSNRSENSTNFLTSRMFLSTKKDRDLNSSLTSRIFFTNKKTTEKSDLSINDLFFNNNSNSYHKKTKENNEDSSLNGLLLNKKDYEAYQLVALNGGKRTKSLFKIVTRMGTGKAGFESPFSNSYAMFWRKEEMKRKFIKI